MCSCANDPYDCYKKSKGMSVSGRCSCSCHMDWHEPKDMTEEASKDEQHWIVLKSDVHRNSIRHFGNTQAFTKAKQLCGYYKERFYVLKVVGYVDPVEPQPPTKKVMHDQ